MRKKAIWIGILFLLLVIGGSIYNGFNGNPLSRALAEKKLLSYLEETYPERHLQIKNSFYNFKYAEYVFHISNPTDKRTDELIFTVKGFIHPEVTEDGIIEAEHQKTAARISGEAAEEMKKHLDEALENVMRVQVDLSGNKPFKKNSKWNKAMKQEHTVAVSVTLNSGRGGKEEFYQQAKAVRERLMGYRYDKLDITGMGLDGEGRPGYAKYSVRIESGKDTALQDVQVLANHEK
ncbi:hypothetical protein ACINLE_20465 [Bacillus sp. z60-18]|uniref:YfjL-like protein n=1 Tax=unclassified Bacillus (in: firmicutes) TaxID=185979 RepID=UPI00390CB6C6